MNLELELIPGLSPAPTLQRYVRTGDVVGASVGAAITGTVHATYTHVWVFDFTGLVAGDYWGVVSGVTTPNGRPFPVRLTATKVYVADSWWQIEVTTAIAAAAGPVTATGLITTPIVIGDDYLASTGRAFSWTIAALTGYSAATATCKFGGKFKTNTWLVTGTIADVGGGNWTLSFDLPRTATQALAEGYYEWSVEVTNASGSEFTRVRSGRNVLLVGKQT